MTLLLSNPKQKLLIGAGLNVLHQESKEWLEIIAFWKHEMNFFTDLLKKKEVKESDYGQMLKTLDKIHKELFDYIAKDIVEHEKYLSRLEKLEKGLTDNKYRDEHKKLSDSMSLFTEDFKQFKMMVFAYVKKL